MLEFLASEMYQADCARKNTMGVRWLCLRDDVAAKYLKRATAAHEAWSADEKRAEGLRKANDPRAFFDKPTAADTEAKG